MRKIYLFMYVSLDGFFEGTNHELDWFVFDEDMEKYSLEQIDEVDTMLFGRVTYQMMAAYWPTDTNNPEIADKMNTTSKIVFSRTLDKADWNNTRLIKENIDEEVMKLKKQHGKDIVIYGSSDLCVSLMKHGLIDEFRIAVNPVILGSGKRLFEGLDNKIKLNLIKSRTFKNGIVLNNYTAEYK